MTFGAVFSIIPRPIVGGTLVPDCQESVVGGLAGTPLLQPRMLAGAGLWRFAGGVWVLGRCFGGPGTACWVVCVSWLSGIGLLRAFGGSRGCCWGRWRDRLVEVCRRSLRPGAVFSTAPDPIVERIGLSTFPKVAVERFQGTPKMLLRDCRVPQSCC